MKRLLQFLTIVLAVGAVIQTVAKTTEKSKGSESKAKEQAGPGKALVETKGKVLISAEKGEPGI